MESQHADEHHRHPGNDAEFQEHNAASSSSAHAGGNRCILILRSNTERCGAECSSFQKTSFQRYFLTFRDRIHESVLRGLSFVFVHVFLLRCSFKKVYCVIPFEQSVQYFVHRSYEKES